MRRSHRHHCDVRGIGALRVPVPAPGASKVVMVCADVGGYCQGDQDDCRRHKLQFSFWRNRMFSYPLMQQRSGKRLILRAKFRVSFEGFEIKKKSVFYIKEESEQRRLSSRPSTMCKGSCTSAQPQRSNVRLRQTGFHARCPNEDAFPAICENLRNLRLNFAGEQEAIPHHFRRSHRHHRFKSRTFARILARCAGLRVFTYRASKR